VLIDKVASNQSFKADRQPAHAKGIQEIDSVDRLVAKMDLLMKSWNLHTRRLARLSFG
jgi:hypothetical protein